jgi:nucleotide-binding universal stress UspA family protein
VDRAVPLEEVAAMTPSSGALVVVGVDGSASSLAAVHSAAEQAALHGCPLLVVHAFNWVPRQAEPADPDPRRTANELVQRAVTVARTVCPQLTITTRILEGSATAALLRQARAAALLVIGDGDLSTHVCLPTHTSAVQVAARARCSVLVARARPPSRGPIVVGVNGSASSEQALDFAFDTAARSRTGLIVVRAWDAPTGADTDDADRIRELADLIAPREDKYHVPARMRVLRGDPAAVLGEESRRAALVIVGARGEQPYGGLLGSAAQTLLHHSPAPLILVRGLMPTVPGSVH